MENEASVGRMRTGKADRDQFEKGMVVTFDDNLEGWKAGDLLIVVTPNGSPLNIIAENADSHRLYITAAVAVGMHLRFWFIPIDARTAHLGMEDHHVDLLKHYYANANG